MIPSSSRLDPTIQAQALAAADRAAPPKAATPAEHLSRPGVEALRTALQSQPEVRPEVVARGRALAADPAYPSSAILQDISRRILQSPDPAEDSGV